MTACGDNQFDAVVIGGGFYGAVIASSLKTRFGMKRVLLIEQEHSLMTRASLRNQARVHNGYHYPRSYKTAYRSRINLPKFAQDWPTAVSSKFTKLYAIASKNSKVTPKQFIRFCKEIGAPVELANPFHRSLFDSRLIESVFQVEEYAFDAQILSKLAHKELCEHQIDMRFATKALGIYPLDSGLNRVTLKRQDGEESSVEGRLVFNCTYTGLDRVRGEFSGLKTTLKHEVTEMALLELPDELNKVAVTVMDGPFFSLMPYPSRNLFTLSHVRYTPHFSWLEEASIDPYKRLDEYEKGSRAHRMLLDTARYMPLISDARHVDSIFEVKTVLAKNETDDGRPILFEEYPDYPGLFSVLGGKIDNIYDILERMEACIKPAV